MEGSRRRKAHELGAKDPVDPFLFIFPPILSSLLKGPTTHINHICSKFCCLDSPHPRGIAKHGKASLLREASAFSFGTVFLPSP